MPQLGSPVSTPSGMPALNQAHLGKLAGAHIHFPSMAAFTAAIASGTAVGASTDLWANGQPMSIAGEPFIAKRYWNGSHARTVLVGLVQFVLAANTNVVLPTSGAPSSGTGSSGDVAVDMSSGLAYVKSGNSWGAGISFGGSSSGGGGGSAGTIQLSAGTYSVGEGGGTLTIPVTRTGGSTGAASVAYATSNGTATAGSDYTATTGTLNWADGDSAARNITVTILQDTTVETAETFSVALSNATGASLGSITSATVTINDDDTSSGVAVREGNFQGGALAETGDSSGYSYAATGGGSFVTGNFPNVSVASGETKTFRATVGGSAGSGSYLGLIAGIANNVDWNAAGNIVFTGGNNGTADFGGGTGPVLVPGDVLDMTIAPTLITVKVNGTTVGTQVVTEAQWFPLIALAGTAALNNLRLI